MFFELFLSHSVVITLLLVLIKWIRESLRLGPGVPLVQVAGPGFPSSFRVPSKERGLQDAEMTDSFRLRVLGVCFGCGLRVCGAFGLCGFGSRVSEHSSPENPSNYSRGRWNLRQLGAPNSAAVDELTKQKRWAIVMPHLLVQFAAVCYSIFWLLRQPVLQVQRSGFRVQALGPGLGLRIIEGYAGVNIVTT